MDKPKLREILKDYKQRGLDLSQTEAEILALFSPLSEKETAKVLLDTCKPSGIANKHC